LAQRVAAVAEILQAEGGFAEWERDGERYEIRDYNCLYRTLNGDDGRPCRWHERVLTGLLGYPVECRGDAPRAVHLCRFAVDPDAVTDRPEGETGESAWLAIQGGAQR
jgi:predicted ArsR family transcriptional regulator